MTESERHYLEQYVAEIAASVKPPAMLTAAARAVAKLDARTETLAYLLYQATADWPAAERGDPTDVVDLLLHYRGAQGFEELPTISDDPSADEYEHADEELWARLQKQIAGKMRAEPMPWPMISSESNAFLPGTTTMIVGTPGASKSFFTLELMWRMQLRGVPVSIMELEDCRSYHCQRMLAQLERIGGMTDPDWVARHPDIVEKAFHKHRAVVREVGERIIIPKRQPTLREVAEHIGERVDAGDRIISVDPISCAATGKHRSRHTADEEFCGLIEKKIKNANCSLLLVTHPRKMPANRRSGQLTIDDLCGGAVYGRTARTIFTLFGSREEDVVVRSWSIDADTGEAKIIEMNAKVVDRRLKALKTRNGKGQGKTFGYTFSGETLQFEEVGEIVPQKRGGN